jgi:signal transduction histidine kinase
MTTRPRPLVAAPAALQLELTRERVQSARRINLVRLWGVSGFFALFLVLGGVLRLPAWTGNLGIFTVYWTITVLVFWASRRFDLIARSARFTIALLDMPMVFFLQWATFETSPRASGIAGFTVGVYVLLVILAALSLERWSIVFTAAVGAGLEVLLQHLAGVSEGGMASTVILMGLTAVVCSYARTRLVELVTRVDREIAAQRQAERALRQSDRMASLGTLAAGVAHEINTPLTYVVTNLALMAERLSPAAPGAHGDAATRMGVEARAAEAEETLALARSGLDVLVGLARGLPDELRHTFGNGLTTTLYALGMVEQQLAALAKEARATGPLDDLLQQARGGAERVRTIVRDLKTFSHPDDDAVKPVDLHRVVRSSINLASVEIRGRAGLRTEFGAVPYVVGSEAPRPGVHQPPAECRAGHPGGRREPPRDPHHHAQRPSGPRACRGERHRLRHRTRAARSNLRPLLHDQARRGRHRPGLVYLPRHRHRARRRALGRERAGARQHVPGHAAARGAGVGGGAAGGPAGAGGSQAAGARGPHSGGGR